MSKDPAVLLYTSDFLTGTLFMNDDQVGKYIKALCSQHQIGHLSEEQINIIVKKDPVVMAKFIKDNQGNFYNKRMHLESEKRKSYSQSRSNNRKNKKLQTKDMKKICKTYVNHMENENEDENKDINKDINKVKDKEIKYKDVFDYYLTLNLKKHKIYTDAMRDSIKRFMTKTKSSIDACKKCLDRNVTAIENTKKKEYPITARGLAEFFGQKVYQGTELIAEQYLDGGKHAEIKVEINTIKEEYGF